MATAAPSFASALAIARPIPLDAPVTNANLPANRAIVVPSVSLSIPPARMAQAAFYREVHLIYATHEKPSMGSLSLSLFSIDPCPCRAVRKRGMDAIAEHESHGLLRLDGASGADAPLNQLTDDAGIGRRCTGRSNTTVPIGHRSNGIV